MTRFDDDSNGKNLAGKANPVPVWIKNTVTDLSHQFMNRGVGISSHSIIFSRCLFNGHASSRVAAIDRRFFQTLRAGPSVEISSEKKFEYAVWILMHELDHRGWVMGPVPKTTSVSSVSSALSPSSSSKSSSSSSSKSSNCAVVGWLFS